MRSTPTSFSNGEIFSNSAGNDSIDVMARPFTRQANGSVTCGLGLVLHPAVGILKTACTLGVPVPRIAPIASPDIHSLQM